MCRMIVGVALLTVGCQALADSAWSSEVELGAVFTGGNTEQESVKFRFDTHRDGVSHTHTLHADAFRASENDSNTAQKYYLSYRMGKRLSEDHGLFARVAYEQDRFSGFDNQMDLTAGYNRTFLSTETMNLSADFGLGAKRSEFDTGVAQTETIGRLAGLYSWQVSSNALFRQALDFEIGEELTTSRSETSLESTISGNLSMKLAFKVKHNSEVVLGKDKSDRESTVTLVYKF
jgi:putative salt-induced outer membrane protein